MRVEPSVCARRARKLSAPSGPCVSRTAAPRGAWPGNVRRRSWSGEEFTCYTLRILSHSLGTSGQTPDLQSQWRRGSGRATQDLVRRRRLRPPKKLGQRRGAPERHMTTHHACHLQEAVGEPDSQMHCEGEGECVKRPWQSPASGSAAAGRSRDGQRVLNLQRSNAASSARRSPKKGMTTGSDEELGLMIMLKSLMSTHITDINEMIQIHGRRIENIENVLIEREKGRQRKRMHACMLVNVSHPSLVAAASVLGHRGLGSRPSRLTVGARQAFLCPVSVRKAQLLLLLPSLLHPVRHHPLVQLLPHRVEL